MKEYLLAALISYLLGSIPFGWIIAKLKGVDIRSKGSGNIGATNVYRVVGKTEGFLTLLFDLLKGLAAVAIFSGLFPNHTYMGVVAGFSAVVGHDFSIFLKFKGGKGVATTYGVVLLLYPLAALIGMAIWIAILLTSKYSSLAALLSFTITTIIAIAGKIATVNKVLFIILLLLMFYRHKENIARLIKKEEHRIKI